MILLDSDHITARRFRVSERAVRLRQRLRTAFDARLGNHKYHITRGPERTPTFSFSETPDPATLLMGVV